MSAPVLHGRRAGRSRGNTPEQAKFQMNGQGYGSPMNEKDLRQVTILSKNDWDRIHYQLNRRAIEEEQIRRQHEDRERMHALSKEKVANWSNTIAGQRLQKLEARKIREKKEEEERRLIDIEEAKFEKVERKIAIEKAKTQQYYQTDRVKNFHSALQLTEVLKEREAQLELKRLMSAAGKDVDKHYLEIERQELERAILRDQDNARKRMQDARDAAKFQKSQINDHLNDNARLRQENDIEGEELKRLAAQNDMEKRKLDAIRAEEAQQLMADNLQQIDDVYKMKKLNQMQEEEEDDECRIFAAAKRKMMKLRAEKEAQLHREKQERLDRIKEKLTAQMQQKQDDEEERTRRAVEEKEAKREKEQLEKEERTRKAFASMAEHRHQQVSEKERKAIEAKKRELEELKLKKETDSLFQRNEMEKQLRRAENEKGLQGFHVQQINERKVKGVRSLEEQRALDKKNEELVQLEEDQFQEYARKVINHAEKGGRNTIPLRKAAKEGAGGGLGPQFPGKGGVRPSYMTADKKGAQLPYYQRATTENTKQLLEGDGRTDLRLGFCW